MNPTPDPIGLISAVASALPGGADYLPMILAYLSLIGGVCVAITALAPAPTTTSPSWWVKAYKVINFFAGNFGHAINAAPAGMPAPVRDAALVSAKAAAVAPELATIAKDVMGKTIIVPGAPPPP